MQRLYPNPASDLPPESIYDGLRADLPEPPTERPYVLLNMVTSVDGKAVLHGGAAGLGSALDHRLMRAIRAAVDAVMNGAATLRAERVDPRVGTERSAQRVARGQSPEPLAVLLSGSGDLPLDRRYFAHPGVPRIVLLGTAAPAERQAALAERTQVIVAPTPQPDPTWALRTLRQDCGMRYLLVEGGPTLNGALIAAGLVDEVCWTLAPKIVGGGESLTMVTGPALPAPHRLTLRSAYLHEDEFFLRYRFVSGDE